MKNFLLIAVLLPYISFAQQPKPKTTTSQKSATTAKKPTQTAKPAATSKPATATKPKTATTTKPKEPSPVVTKLVDKAYVLYKENKDKECEATVKQILALDPKNKDAFMLRANMAMFAGNTDEIWKNLDLIYQYYPDEPEIYSQFAVNHLTYTFFSDSMKRVLCRKTILLSSKYGEGYASLGLVAAVGGNYDEAVHYFNLSFTKKWKDTNSRTILKLPYARCQYEMGQKQEAVNTISELIPKMKGEDRYTCIYMRATYKMELGQYDVQNDIDTLLNIYPNDIGVRKLKLVYLKSTVKEIGSNDSLCLLAKEIRNMSENNSFDIEPYCENIVKTISVKDNSKLTYDNNGNPFIMELNRFDYNKEIRIKWSHNKTATTWESGEITLTKSAIDSAVLQQNNFFNGRTESYQNSLTGWLSHKQFNDMTQDSMTVIATDGMNVSRWRHAGHEQIEVLNSKNETLLLDCIRIISGDESILYLNDINNPLITKMTLKTMSMVLSKFE